MSFIGTVEDWRDLVTAQAGDVPVEYLLAWILRESNGSPCSWVTKTQEAGIFQLMPPDNIAQGGTTLAAMHPVPPCTAGVQTSKWFSDLTDAQANEQVRAGIQYVNYARSRVHQLLVQYGGQDWDENQDFWTMVKMYHNLPGVIPPGLTAAQSALGAPVQTWADFRQYAGSYNKWLNYAEWIGAYAANGPTIQQQVASEIDDLTDPVSTPPPPPPSLWMLGLVAGLGALFGAWFSIKRRRKV